MSPPLLAVAWRTSRGASNQTFFIGSRDINWMLLAFGMVGATAFSYFQIVLGLFAFGILTRRQPRDAWVPLVAICAPLLSWLIDSQQRGLYGAYQLGLELLLVNGALTFAGLWTLSVAPMRPTLAHAAPTLGASQP